MTLPLDITERLAEDYPTDGGQAAAAVLETIPNLSPRVARCVIFLADGKHDRLLRYARAAKEDPRDVMFWAEYENHNDRSPLLVRDFSQPFGMHAAA